MSTKLTTRLIIIMASLLFAFIFLFTMAFSFIFWHHAKNVEQARMETKLLNIADNIGKNYHGKDLTRSYGNKFFQISNTLGDGELWIVDKNTLHIAGAKDYPKLTYDQLTGANAKDIQQILAGNHIESSSFADFNENLPLTAGVPIKDSQGDIIGALLVHYSPPAYFNFWYDSLGIAIFTTVIIYLLLLWLTVVLVRKYTMPLKVFDYYLERLTRGDYSAKLKIKNSTDFESLANHLNYLTEYLDEQRESCKNDKLHNKTVLLNSAYANYEIARDFEKLLEDMRPYLAKFLPKALTKRLLSFHNIFINSTANLFKEETPFLLGFDIKDLNVLDSLKAALSVMDPVFKAKEIAIFQQNELPAGLILHQGDEERLKQMFLTVFRLAAAVTPDKATITIDYIEDPSRYLITIYAPTFKDHIGELANNIHFLMARNLAHLQGMDLRFESQTVTPCYRLIINKQHIE